MRRAPPDPHRRGPKRRFLIGRKHLVASVKTLTDEAGKVRGYRVRYRTGAGRPLSKTFPVGAKGKADSVSR